MDDFVERHATLQQRTVVTYGQLVAMNPDWSRRLVMVDAGDAAAPFALAALAAGGAVLSILSDAIALRRTGQEGITDFQVTGLSEAVRILKNEVRKGLPVSVGVLDMHGSVWTEAVERGLQPYAVVAAEPTPAVATLIERGAMRLQPGPVVPGAVYRAGSWRERRAGDVALLAAVRELAEAEREVAVRWLRVAPRLFPRDTDRWFLPAWQASNENT